MGDKAAEQLSALMDDELDDAELLLLLRRIREDDEDGERWQRFHLAREAMRNGLPDRLDIGLAGRVRDVIDADPTPPVSVAPMPRVGRGRRLRPVVGLAAAASLAAVVAVGLKISDEIAESPLGPRAEAEVPRLAAQPQADDAAVASLFVPAESRIEAKMYPYLRNHNEQVSRNIAPNVLPLGRMVGYEIQR